MTIAEIQALQATAGSAPARDNPQGPGPEQAARNRELAKAVKTINEQGSLGSQNELRFGIDRDTGQALIKIVDRITNEVITQVPPEAVLRTAHMLRQLSEGEQIA